MQDWMIGSVGQGMGALYLFFFIGLLVTALGVMLLMTAGASFALAMGTVGVMTWAMAHEHGLASFINNPAAATGSYLANVTAGQLAWDLLDFALTFVPGSVLGAGGHPRSLRPQAGCCG